MKVEVFFDYLCPYCEQGYRYFEALLPQYPKAEPVYRPCEAQPRTETPYGRHSDTAISGMFFVQDQGGDVAAYNDAVYKNVYLHHKHIEDVEMLADCGELAGVNRLAFLAALKDNAYAQQQLNANNYAYAKKKIYAIPVFIAEEGKRLDAALGVGVTKAQVAEVLESANR